MTRDLDNEKASDGASNLKTTVPLKFSHLFAAYAFTIFNDSPSELKLVNIVLKVNDTGRATVDYSNVWNTAKGDPDATFSGIIFKNAEDAVSTSDTYSPIVIYYESEQRATTLGTAADGTTVKGIQGRAGINGSSEATDTSDPHTLTLGAGATANLIVSGVDEGTPKQPAKVNSSRGESAENNSIQVATPADDQTFTVTDEDYRIIWPQDLYWSTTDGSTATDKSLEITFEKTVLKQVESGSHYVIDSNGAFYVQSASQSQDGHYSHEQYVDGRQSYSRFNYVEDNSVGGTYYDVKFSRSWPSSADFLNDRYSEVIDYMSEESKELITKIIDLSEVTPANSEGQARWEPGCKYLYNLVYTGNEIALTVRVVKWNSDHGGSVTFE